MSGNEPPRLYPPPPGPLESGIRPWLMVILVTVGGSLAGYFYALWEGDAPANPSSTVVTKPRSPRPPLSPFYPETLVKVLLLGTDDKIERGRTDTIILLLLDLSTKKVGALSLPRDTRVYLPEYGFQKINAAYPLGGPELTRDAVSSLLGTAVWYYIKTDLSGFQKIIDLVGGVDLNVEKRMWYRDRAQGLTINLYPGTQHLDGSRAMQYVRFRRDAAGDFGRIKRQHKLLKALARKALEAENLTKLPQVVQQVRERVRTNLSLLQMITLARFLQEADLERAVALQLPTVPERIEGVYFLLPQEAGRSVVAQVIDRMNHPTTVLVCSDENLSSLAEEVTMRLRREGFEMESPVTQAGLSSAHTTVFDVSHRAEEAQHIATLLGGTVDTLKTWDLSPEPGVDVVVVLGQDCKTVDS